MNDLEFLTLAKRNTYAADGGSSAEKMGDGGKELRYADGERLYRDRYYGGEPFIGEEVLISGGKVCWSMNYYGCVLDGGAQAGAVYEFLTHALREARPEAPYRGPQTWTEGDWRYTCRHTGSFERFEGEERIDYQGAPVYRLVFHGGVVDRSAG